MKLNQLIANAPAFTIDHLMVDSRETLKNSIFFCLSGLMHNGHDFIDMAIDHGAVAIVHSEPLKNTRPTIYYHQVQDPLATLNDFAERFYGSPSNSLYIFGVTGTNGKSTIAYTIHNLLNSHHTSGYIGTIAIEYGKHRLPPLLTTPDIVPLHEMMADMVKAGTTTLALEVSSHGLEQNRVGSVGFDTVIFTNLTHDHLDFHGTMENYFESKKKLFTMVGPNQTAIINVDDPYGVRLLHETRARVLTYGIEDEADYRASDIQLHPESTDFTLHTPVGRYHVTTNLVAMFNVYNLLAIIAALHQYGMELSDIIDKVAEVRQVDGRMEKIRCGQPFQVIVDYAHTPDGFEKAFAYAKAITPKSGKILTVFGSAGQRDVKKRPILGQIASQYSETVILTEEDPRSEDPLAICADIAKGITGKYLTIENRYDAIEQAIQLANRNDTIMILGKGDEDYLYREFGKEHWMGDQVAARVILQALVSTQEENQ
ncbi:MAG: UDP-N-acetylmuramoyl-L-alanyl-D-glutamate--2,6-diaminopimelate ligase [Erysipelotrichaceae bacterium]|jgi:UDP-N-acetylmuramyl-tripeptide synthetase|nr:UDP-N-acetylmuramoyl-L-alanyl-D-glutamate--2,6-diaminopimelate ligase [Erysipelotrichaceae bacterium]